jgi:hypothetical protein
MASLEQLLASYLDLARHLDPLRHPHEAPAEVHARLGRFDRPWLTAQASALKSIANAIEDLEDVEDLDDEVDRTMLIDTVRAEVLRLDDAVGREWADPGLPLRHAMLALEILMGEDFDAAHETALRARVAELPGFLGTLQDDSRPAPAFLVEAAGRAVEGLAERLDIASERLDDELVAPVLTALALHRDWIADPARVGGELGIGEEAVEARLHLLSPDPVGVKGALRILELRRTGVERSLMAAADELGYDTDWRAALDALPEIAELDPLGRLDAWEEEWARVGHALAELGGQMPMLPAPPAPMADDRATLGALAGRGWGAAIFEAGRLAQERPVRRLLVAPGLRRGWERSVAAVTRETAVLGSPERRLASAHLAIRDNVAAETDLLLQARHGTAEELTQRAAEHAGLDLDTARDLVVTVASEPFETLAAGLAHEGWQGWYAEAGESPVEFLRLATQGGGLAVPMARWALEVGS